MAEILAAPAPAAPAPSEAGKGVEKKSGNVSMAQATARLIHNLDTFRTAGTFEKPAATITPPAQPGGEPAPAEKPTVSPATPDAPDAPPPAAPAAPDAKPEDAPEEVPTDLSQLSNLDPKTQELFKSLLEAQKIKSQEAIDRRIGKEVAKRKALEEQLANRPATAPFPIQAAPNQAPIVPQVAMPTVEGPLSTVNDANGLAAKQREARAVREAVEDAIALGPNETGKFSVDGKEFSKEQLISIRRGASDMLEVQIPQRYQFLQERQAAVKLANDTFPWLQNTSSPEYQQALSILNMNPWMRGLPRMEYVLGTFVTGQQALSGKQPSTAAAAKPAAKPKPPGDQTIAAAAASSNSRENPGVQADAAMKAAIGKLKGKGGATARDMAQLLAQRETLSRNR